MSNDKPEWEEASVYEEITHTCTVCMSEIQDCSKCDEYLEENGKIIYCDGEGNHICEHCYEKGE